MSTPSMSCERVMRTECSFNDDNTTYISHWPRQKCPNDWQIKCKITSYPACHVWMHHSSNETCDLYERDKRDILLEVLLHWQLFIVQVCKQRNMIIVCILISYWSDGFNIFLFDELYCGSEYIGRHLILDIKSTHFNT